MTQHSSVFKIEPLFKKMFQQIATDQSKFKCNRKAMDIVPNIYRFPMNYYVCCGK